MAHIIAEFKRELPGSIAPQGNVLFDPPSQDLPGMVYDPATGEITLNEPGLYLVKWWIATETVLRGIMEFALVSDSGGSIPGCSPIKTGQVSGFGAIDAKAPGTKLWLGRKPGEKIIFSIKAGVKAYMLITRVQSAYPSGLVGVYHTNLAASGSSYEVTIENVVYRLQNPAGVISLWLKSTGGTVVVDVKRSSQYDAAGVEGQTLNNYNLTTTPVSLDGTIYNTSNEMHRTWIRQKDPVTGLWSLYEVDLFISSAGARASICVYLIYKDMDLTGL